MSNLRYFTATELQHNLYIPCHPNLKVSSLDYMAHLYRLHLLIRWHWLQHLSHHAHLQYGPVFSEHFPL
jgi:hypothetical protein